MAEGSEQQDSAPLPPKLDLRKHAVDTPDEGEKPAAKPAPAAPPAEEPKIKIPGMSDLTAPPEPATPSSTIRIKMPDEASQGEPARRLTLAQPGAAAPKPAIPKAAQPAAKPAVPVAAAPAGSKKDTSKIPLSAAQPADAAAGTPKTIRIKPRTTAPTTQARKPAVPPTGVIPPVEEDSDAATKEAAKRQTSRISLESALDADDGAADADAPETPKTIRLKRPSEAATVKMKPRPTGDSDAGAGVAEKSRLGETARLDELPIAEEGATATRRRTIKVKRPTQRATVSVGGPTGGTPAEAEDDEPLSGPTLPLYAQQPLAEEASDGAHWFFVMCACLAVVVGLGLLYLLSAQTFGPNSSGTRLSYAPTGPKLAWPGRIDN